MCSHEFKFVSNYHCKALKQHPLIKLLCFERAPTWAAAGLFVFHRRFRMAVWKFVTLSNFSSNRNFACNGTKEGLIKPALGTHYAEVSRKFLCTDFSFFERHNQMSFFDFKKQPNFASNLNLVWGGLQGGLTVDARASCSWNFFSNKFW